MRFARITAIVRSSVLEEVEKALHDAGVPGMSVSHVKGYGEYADFFRGDWMLTQARIEVYSSAARAEEIAGIIVEAAHTGVEGDGLVAVEPVSAIYHVRTRKRCEEDAC